MNEKVQFCKETRLKKTEIGEIPEEWEVVKLRGIVERDSDIVAGPFGSNLKVCDYKPDGVPIIRLQNIERNQFVDKDIKHISLEKARELRYHSYQPGDIVLAKLGDPIGKTCIVPSSMKAGVVVADVVRIRPSLKKTITLFVEYMLNCSVCYDQLRRETIGSTRPRVNISQVRNLKMPLPPLDEQQKIASVLLTIDKAIRKTDEIIQKAQELKKGLMQKLLTKGIGHTKFKKTEIGEIPEEWEVVRVGEIVSFEYGKGLPARKRKSGTYPVYGSNGIVGYHNEPLVKGPGIIVGRKGTISGVIWSEKDFWPIDTTYYVKVKRSGIVLRWLYYRLTSLRLEMLNMATGVPGLNRNLVYDVRIGLPPYTEQQKITNVLSTVDKEIEKEKQIKEQLEKTMEWFMGNLLTGKIRVKVD
jgi:type I restriction enzyme S subunit